MDKRATRQITLYTILFLVMLIFSGITFFLGLQVGVEKTEEKYAHYLVDETATANYQYQQQDLVTFYITTYSAFEEYQNAWFESIQAISSNKVTNPANVFDELATKAAKQATAAGSTNMQGLGLLDSSQKNYIRSLTYFEKAAKSLVKSTDKKSASEALSIINNDDNYKIAIEQALKAQQEYYNTMYIWSTSIDANIASSFDTTITQAISTWDKYPLIIKLQIISNYLNDNKVFKNASPQDIVSRIDEFIVNGQASQLNLTKVNDVLNLLIATDAIRHGDYNQYKGTRYKDEFLPQIPSLNAN